MSAIDCDAFPEILNKVLVMAHTQIVCSTEIQKFFPIGFNRSSWKLVRLKYIHQEMSLVVVQKCASPVFVRINDPTKIESNTRCRVVFNQ